MHLKELASSQSTSTESKPQSLSFLHYIHNFRGLSILFIVATHVLAKLDWKDDKAEKLANILIGNGTVFFVFIAGFLFQFLSQKYKFKNYLNKKIQYVIVPYLIVSIPGLIYVFSKHQLPDWFNYQFFGLPLWHQVIMCLLTGAHMLQYWFIPMITIFYIVSPILIWVDRRPWFYCFLPLLIVVTLIVPRPDFNNDSFQSFIHFFSIYLAGMFCSHFRERFFIFMRQWYILPTCAFIILTALEYFWMPVPVNTNSVNSVSKLILSGLLIYFFWLNEQHLPKTIDKTMSLLAEYSFGIFFLHEYFILGGLSLAGKIGIKSQFVNYSLPTFVIQCFFSIGGSIIAIIIIKKIFRKNSRWVVGC